ncbi:MAG: glycogen debranching enzyme N-terminal domain-containing protein [Candidatus Schekmanbacteria bacterium]|nr:glycogen debranching enzyme N-terminal domain-containing protein [Candidatus Schekmanbacteria bacterium]
MISFGKDVVSNLKIALRKEWLLTNGLGGYASSTVIGCNTRRHHGLLVVPAGTSDDPGRKAVLLSKFEEVLQVGNNAYKISTNKYPKTVHPQGYLLIQEFTLSPFPRMVFMMEDIILEKEVFMPQGINAVVITYRIFPADRDVNFIISPLVAFREAGMLIEPHSDDYDLKMKNGKGFTMFHPEPELPPLYLYYPDDITFVTGGCWYHNFEYDTDKNTEKEFAEDLFDAGYFMAVLKSKTEFSLIASSEELPAGFDAGEERMRELKRLNSIREKCGSQTDWNEFMLMKAAESFISQERTPVEGFSGRSSIVSGYHWGSESKRDAMMAMTGLLISTGKKEECEKEFVRAVPLLRESIVSENPTGSNNDLVADAVEACLWMINSSYHYSSEFSGCAFIKDNLFGIFKEIISFLTGAGISSGIKMDTDGLLVSHRRKTDVPYHSLCSGVEGSAPKYGKEIEVQSLWYNALRIMEKYSKEYGVDGGSYSALADRVSQSIVSQFWYANGSYLCDFVSDWGQDTSFTSNQIFAVALPFTALPMDKAERVVEVVHRHLLFAFGLRCCGEINRYIYAGDHDHPSESLFAEKVMLRPWTLAAFIDAYLYVKGYSRVALVKANMILEPLLLHLNDAGLGYISECFDADKPNSPEGCIAHALSLAEVLRIKKKIDKLLMSSSTI